ncbi:hypothetical protein AV530_017965 [Patagioenas fasciata monilis]|uniref:Uncharacterized protein n=1 Tax=Patagioenas fasciata monilis TaxID=372326 RepID=A0A1V4KKB8_PATFA|nr:hypothetical protein AV530_017965 [Patagioenas fasciata monilis]
MVNDSDLEWENVLVLPDSSYKKLSEAIPVGEKETSKPNQPKSKVIESPLKPKGYNPVPQPGKQQGAVPGGGRCENHNWTDGVTRLFTSPALLSLGSNLRKAKWKARKAEKTPTEPASIHFMAGSGPQTPETVPFWDQDPEMLQEIWAGAGPLAEDIRCDLLQVWDPKSSRTGWDRQQSVAQELPAVLFQFRGSCNRKDQLLENPWKALGESHGRKTSSGGFPLCTFSH